MYLSIHPFVEELMFQKAIILATSSLTKLLAPSLQALLLPVFLEKSFHGIVSTLTLIRLLICKGRCQRTARMAVLEFGGIIQIFLIENGLCLFESASL